MIALLNEVYDGVVGFFISQFFIFVIAKFTQIKTVNTLFHQWTWNSHAHTIEQRNQWVYFLINSIFLRLQIWEVFLLKGTKVK